MYRIWAVIVAFFVTLITLIRSSAYRVTKKLPDTVSETSNNISDLAVESVPMEEFRPPSPAPRLTKADLLTCAFKKLSELEEKVDILQAKPFSMPYEKEELLNAAVCRVDALEAELIATKKVIESQLMDMYDFLVCLFQWFVEWWWSFPSSSCRLYMKL